MTYNINYAYIIAWEMGVVKGNCGEKGLECKQSTFTL